MVVAEELHFTQAAERLHVAQPALSKAIRRLESELGFPLFARSRHSVALTSAGLALLPGARAVLAELDAAVRVAQTAHRSAAHVLRVGYHSSVGSDLLGPIIDEFRRLRPGWQVELRAGDWSDPAGAVLAGRSDLVLLRPPVPGQEDLDLAVLRSDDRWVALPAGHRLADREVVRLAELAGEPFVAMPAESGPFRDFWLARDRFAEPPVIGAEVNNTDDWLEAIATGRGVALLSETSVRIHRRPGLVYRPVPGAGRSELVVAWRSGSTDPVLRDFVRAATEISGG
ncbi:LysR family transcriptional regulator [Amycolatopsis benzoatilytica]|uniref:LysR family transcriptional regulator n=1 Tax=Amycolatopsis benzoatilytica TaxID=346045 RepID=UPI0003636AF4|nr:LysR family transcriptional regulator [Amycolatopsis benzoatilytica]